MVMNISEVRANEHAVGEKTAATFQKLFTPPKSNSNFNAVFSKTVIHRRRQFSLIKNCISLKRYPEKFILTEKQEVNRRERRKIQRCEDEQNCKFGVQLQL